MYIIALKDLYSKKKLILSLKYGTLHCNAPVAQSVEQLPFKEMVVGSIPTGRTKYYVIIFYMLEDYDPFEKEKKAGIPSEVLAKKYIQQVTKEQEELKRELFPKPKVKVNSAEENLENGFSKN